MMIDQNDVNKTAASTSKKLSPTSVTSTTNNADDINNITLQFTTNDKSVELGSQQVDSGSNTDRDIIPDWRFNCDAINITSAKIRVSTQTDASKLIGSNDNKMDSSPAVSTNINVSKTDPDPTQKSIANLSFKNGGAVVPQHYPQSRLHIYQHSLLLNIPSHCDLPFPFNLLCFTYYGTQVIKRSFAELMVHFALQFIWCAIECIIVVTLWLWNGKKMTEAQSFDTSCSVVVGAAGTGEEKLSVENHSNCLPSVAEEDVKTSSLLLIPDEW